METDADPKLIRESWKIAPKGAMVRSAKRCQMPTGQCKDCACARASSGTRWWAAMPAYRDRGFL